MQVCVLTKTCTMLHLKAAFCLCEAHCAMFVIAILRRTTNDIAIVSVHRLNVNFFFPNVFFGRRPRQIVLRHMCAHWTAMHQFVDTTGNMFSFRGSPSVLSQTMFDRSHWRASDSKERVEATGLELEQRQKQRRMS